jgi:hypothetical protein
MSTAFASRKFKWLEHVAQDRSLLHVDVRVAVALLRYFNERDQNGRAFPGYQTLANTIGASEHSVIRAVRRLHERGYLVVVSGKPGRGHPNQYWMSEKPAPVQVSEGGKPAPTQVKKPAPTQVSKARKPASDANKTCTRAVDSLRDSIGEGDAKASPFSYERDSHLSVRTRLAAVGGCADAPPPAEALDDGETILDGEILPPQESAANPPEDQQENNTLGALQALWQRGHPSDATAAYKARVERAWKRACENNDPSVIMAGARAHVAAAETADGLRYLMKLYEFLDTEAFKKPPPPKKQSRARSGSRKRGQRGKGDASAAMARLARD